MQPTLYEADGYIDDITTFGELDPIARHYDHSNSLMRRPFVSWDGEGYTDAWGDHHYWLLKNSLGDQIVAPPGRSIERWNVARLFHSVQSRYSHCIHTGFALGYDFTMLLRANGINADQRKTMARKQWIDADGYMWKCLMGKQLNVWPSGDGDNRGLSGKGDKFNLQDSWGFFQRSFVAALDEYFSNPDFNKNYYPGKSPEKQDTIDNPRGVWPNTSASERLYLIEMKKNRSTFTRGLDEDANTQKYCAMELRLHVALMEELRDRLFESGMPISRWYGPGAIANGLLQKWSIKTKIVDLYKEAPNIAGVAQHAYAGGRFELVKPGHINAPVYQYDVNSAYPYALSSLPNLADGEWLHHNQPNLADLPSVSCVRIRWRTGNDYSSVANGRSEMELYPLSIPFPFYRRTPNKNIHFPSTGIHGWYWLPEVVAGINYSDSLPGYYNASYTIEEAYSYYPATDEKPYSIIMDLYELRQKLKASNNGAHIGLKLGLNSLYGKFCQQLGWDEKTKKIPQFHNLAIGGMITATCRAAMINATALDPSAIIAYETDGVFSTRPLALPVNTDLGGWDETIYDDMWYMQSGFRFGIKDGQVIKSATRGIPSKDVSLTAIRGSIKDSLSSLSVNHTQFITLGQAYAWNKPHTAGQWKTSPRQLSVMLENFNGKRIHDPDCSECDMDNEGVRTYRWNHPHVTVPARGYEGSLSHPHGVLWSKLNSEPEEYNIDQDVLIMP